MGKSLLVCLQNKMARNKTGQVYERGRGLPADNVSFSAADLSTHRRWPARGSWNPLSRPRTHLPLHRCHGPGFRASSLFPVDVGPGAERADIVTASPILRGGDTAPLYLLRLWLQESRVSQCHSVAVAAVRRHCPHTSLL